MITPADRRFCRVAGRLVVLCLISMLAACQAAPTPGPKSSPMPTYIGTAGLATVHVFLSPPGGAVYLDGDEVGRTPSELRLPAAQYDVLVVKQGYEDWKRRLELRPGDELVLDSAMTDIAPPQIAMGEVPGALEASDALRVTAEGTDNEGVVLMRLWINGLLVAESEGSSISFVWELAGVEAGLHELVVEAHDRAGNRSAESRRVEVLVARQAEPSMAPVSTPPEEAGTTAHVTAINLNSYPYEPFLRERLDPVTGFRLLWFDRAAYEASAPQPQQRTFEAVVLENPYLRLMFLPEFGGRLYRCTLKATDQNIFYQNEVLKPSYWGPLSRDENWWMAAGGMEWALPVSEHGYEWGLPWEYEIERTADGMAIVLSDMAAEARSNSDRPRAEIRVTLPDNRAYFVVAPRVENPTSRIVPMQFWLNAMLTLGSSSTSFNTEFVYPADRMIVHSTGDPALPGERQTMSWPIYEGRDLSEYRNWRNWLGVFVPDVRRDYAGAYNHDTGMGVVRIFPAEIVPGLKLFAFGEGFPARAEYSDDGSDYFEVWAGPCRTFWAEDDLALAPKQSLTWTEVWWPFQGTGGIDQASAEIVARADVDQRQLSVRIASSTDRRARVQLSWDGHVLLEEAVGLTPEEPHQMYGVLPEGAMLPGELNVQVVDEGGATLLEYTKAFDALEEDQ